MALYPTQLPSAGEKHLGRAKRPMVRIAGARRRGPGFWVLMEKHHLLAWMGARQKRRRFHFNH